MRLEYSTRLRSLCVQGSHIVVGSALLLQSVWIDTQVDSVGCPVLSLWTFHWKVLHILVQVAGDRRIREAVQGCRSGWGRRGPCSPLPVGVGMWVPSSAHLLLHQAQHNLGTMEKCYRNMKTNTGIPKLPFLWSGHVQPKLFKVNLLYIHFFFLQILMNKTFHG